MMKSMRPLLLAAGFVTMAALPAQAVGDYATNDAGHSTMNLNTMPTTSDVNTVTDDTLIFDEPFTNDPMADDIRSAPPIAGDLEASPVPVALDQSSEFARNLKLRVSHNSALSIAGQDVKLLRVGDRIVLDGTAANAAEANSISKLVNQFSQGQIVLNQLQLADETVIDDSTLETF